MLKNLFAVVFAAIAGLFAVPAFALAPATLADLTTGISFADVSLGILAVAALMIGVYVIWKGAKMVIHAVKGM